MVGVVWMKEGVVLVFVVLVLVEGKIVMFLGEYYCVCVVGGMLCCGLMYMGVMFIDVVKCNM